MHYDIPKAWTKAGGCEGTIVVELREGDTATNYASTKGDLVGPSMIAYEMRRSGIRMWEFDGTPMRTPSFVREGVRYGEVVWLDD